MRNQLRILMTLVVLSHPVNAQITMCSWLDRHKQQAVDELPDLIAQDVRLQNWEYEVTNDIFKYQYFRHKKECGVTVSPKNGNGPPILVKFDDWSLKFIEIDIIDIVQ